jgi:hypothetical protein
VNTHRRTSHHRLDDSLRSQDSFFGPDQRERKSISVSSGTSHSPKGANLTSSFSLNWYYLTNFLPRQHVAELTRGSERDRWSSGRAAEEMAAKVMGRALRHKLQVLPQSRSHSKCAPKTGR